MIPIYLDNNATTRCDPAVVQAMLPFFTEHFGNASSIHAFGSEVGKALKKAPPAAPSPTRPPSSRRSRRSRTATR
jgi:cysteine sulfinate desulfinase/cysteine desulfurase-like protein